MVDPSAPADDIQAPVASAAAQDLIDDSPPPVDDASDTGTEAGIEALVVTDSSRPWWLVGTAVVALALLMAVVGWYVVSDRNKSASAKSGTVAIKDVTDYDPGGVDGVENPGTVHLAVDGKKSTAWSTEQYTTPDFGGDKAGVGLVLDLGKPVAVSAVEVDAGNAGWSAEIYVADTAGALVDDWGQPVATGTELPASVRLALPASKTGRFVLLWITQLPPRGQLAVAEVRVVS